MPHGESRTWRNEVGSSPLAMQTYCSQPWNGWCGGWLVNWCCSNEHVMIGSPRVLPSRLFLYILLSFRLNSSTSLFTVVQLPSLHTGTSFINSITRRLSTRSLSNNEGLHPGPCSLCCRCPLGWQRPQGVWRRLCCSPSCEFTCCFLQPSILTLRVLGLRFQPPTQLGRQPLP